MSNINDYTPVHVELVLGVPAAEIEDAIQRGDAPLPDYREHGEPRWLESTVLAWQQVRAISYASSRQGQEEMRQVLRLVDGTLFDFLNDDDDNNKPKE